MDITEPIRNLIEPGSIYDNGGGLVTIPRGPYVNSVTGSIGNTTDSTINKVLIDQGITSQSYYPWDDPDDKWWDNKRLHKWTRIKSKTIIEIITPDPINLKNKSNKICTWSYIENTLGGQTGSYIYSTTNDDTWSSENDKTKCPTYNSVFIKKWNYKNNSGNSTNWVEESDVIQHSLRNRSSISYVGSNQRPSTTQLLKQSDVNKMVTIEVGQYLKYVNNPTDKLTCDKDYGKEYVLPAYSKNLVYLDESGELLRTETNDKDSNYVRITDSSPYASFPGGIDYYNTYDGRVFIIGGLSFQTSYDNLPKYSKGKSFRYCDYSIVKDNNCIRNPLDPIKTPDDGGGLIPKPIGPWGKLQDAPHSGILMSGAGHTELDCLFCGPVITGDKKCFCNYLITGKLWGDTNFPPYSSEYFSLWGDLGGINTPIYTKSKTYKYVGGNAVIDKQFEFGHYYDIKNIKTLLKDELAYFNNLGYSVRLIVNMYILTSGPIYNPNN